MIRDELAFMAGWIGETLSNAWEFFLDRLWTWVYEVRDFIEGNW